MTPSYSVSTAEIALFSLDLVSDRRITIQCMHKTSKVAGRLPLLQLLQHLSLELQKRV